MSHRFSNSEKAGDGSNEDELIHWYVQWNEQVDDATYKFKDGESNSDSSHQKVFNKLMDYYDPTSKDYLMSYYVFKTLYELRDTCA